MKASRGRTGSFLDAGGCTANRPGFQRALCKFDHVCGGLWLQQLHSDLMGNPGVLLHGNLLQFDNSHPCNLHASSCTSHTGQSKEGIIWWRFLLAVDISILITEESPLIVRRLAARC